MRTCPECQRTYADEMDFCPRDGTRLPPRRSTDQVALNAGLSERYRIVRRLGEGGMGTVFLAEQLTIGSRLVALKILRPRLLDDPQFLRRFQEEASSTGRIHHQNVVTVHECGQADDGSPYIAMEYLEGESLAQAIKRRGALPLPESADILQQAARGLNAAHKLNIIHRDLKPDNILLTTDDEGRLLVKIVDFGIAKIREAENQTATATGLAVGTPAYMSFEQASGMRSEELDGRSDVYSLGVVAYEMISGRLPFKADTPMAYVRKHVFESPAPLRDVPPQLERVVLKALRKERDERYATATEFAREFASATLPASAPPIFDPPVAGNTPAGVPLDGEIPPRPEPIAATPAANTKPRSSSAKIAAAATLVLLVAAALSWYVLSHRTRPNTPVAVDPQKTTPAGTVRVNPKDGQPYVWIPAGFFLMGCSVGDAACHDDEKPPHVVTLNKGFWMGQTAVTVGAWRRYRTATGEKALPFADNLGRKNWNEAGTDNMPAVMMTWDEAKSYCQWVSMRLPTEAEWEYAARAGTTTPRYGDLDSISWYGDNSGTRKFDSMTMWNQVDQDGQLYQKKLYQKGAFIHPVGQKKPNAWMLYDMLGNVYAWTADWYDSGYYSRSEREDPPGPSKRQYRVARGGSWYGGGRDVRASYRVRQDPVYRDYSFGCRCVGDLP